MATVVGEVEVVADAGEAAHVRVIRKVAVNDRGYRIGETHHNSTISDATVKMIRDLHEYERLGYRAIARRLGLSYHTVKAIGGYVRRAQVAADWRQVCRSD